MLKLDKQKKKFIFIQLFLIIFSFILILLFQPKETGWWIFKSTEYYSEYFIGAAFIISSFYMTLLTI